MSWTDRHQNWALLLWLILAPAICLVISFVGYFILYETFPFLINQFISAMLIATIFSEVIVLIYFYRKRKRGKGVVDKIIDRVLLFLVGLVGLIVFFGLVWIISALT